MDYGDEIARLRAEMEQAREGLKELASALWIFYSELIEQGFKSDQAMMLCLGWLQGMLGPRGSDD